ncbi:zinc ribbon domain-containing protein [Kovacikia minuta CCNUW1]|uniref:zinc ribbon domain-containing protein n=1 Tax=Kovacikia minuta TaxID=2931930 RepID=UPI001CC94BC4|nr:zinc ribbon domain-containing protein [Kovacikia minuta]UBF24809.1 zinc ribbon domain-containing protein [Kovacikia minuta CCNUW1]
MPECPRCHQAVDTQAIACPFCRTPLKAYGHPGVPLYRATGKEPLCLTCTYHEDDSCTFPQRPDAMECTLYSDRTKPNLTKTQPGYTGSFLVKTWFKRNLTWIMLLGLLLFSLLLVLLR